MSPKFSFSYSSYLLSSYSISLISSYISWLTCYFLLKKKINSKSSSPCFPVTIEKMECTFHPVLTANTFCDFIKINQTTILISYGLNATKSQNSLFARLKNYHQIGKNRYKNGIFDITLDMCNFFQTVDQNPFIRYLVPTINEFAKQFDFHSCPYNSVSLLAKVLNW